MEGGSQARRVKKSRLPHLLAPWILCLPCVWMTREQRLQCSRQNARLAPCGSEGSRPEARAGVR